eukprot:GHVU01031320.1.p2 GENE.GHVU01031320.1~~GHVU01031320.1.p2  ORF type:complete len:107 (-),score=5.24 GHVU01031320.1:25-345(-)
MIELWVWVRPGLLRVSECVCVCVCACVCVLVRAQEIAAVNKVYGARPFTWAARTPRLQFTEASQPVAAVHTRGDGPTSSSTRARTHTHRTWTLTHARAHTHIVPGL